MTDRFDDLVEDAELGSVQREQLRRTHDLLLQADAPAEVPAHLRSAPAVETPAPVPRRQPGWAAWLQRRPAFAVAAAVLVAALFSAGYVIGDHGPQPVAVIEMSGAGATASASASIDLLPQDESGNWPMLVHVRGLEPSTSRQDYYELWLSKGGRLVRSCGRFTVHEGLTTVTLSVPYALRAFDGWVVTRQDSSRPLLSTT